MYRPVSTAAVEGSSNSDPYVQAFSLLLLSMEASVAIHMYRPVSTAAVEGRFNGDPYVQACVYCCYRGKLQWRSICTGLCLLLLSRDAPVAIHMYRPLSTAAVEGSFSGGSIYHYVGLCPLLSRKGGLNKFQGQ